MTECIPIDTFQHNELRPRRGVPIMVADALALDWERQGLVRICKSRDEHPSPNAPAAGQAQQLSALPAAPALPKRHVITLKRGVGRPRKEAA